jgi:malate dehydrogenase (oxaloacetate-decarboxylating)(NADP+)
MSFSTLSMGPLPVARLPPFLMSTDHRKRCLNQLRSKATGLEKYIYLNGLKERDPNLFYEVLLGNMLEIIPILYTPIVNLLSRSISHRRLLTPILLR